MWPNLGGCRRLCCDSIRSATREEPFVLDQEYEVVQVYTKVRDFWLPVRNSSVATIRLGGHAELTILYNAYQITSADSVGNLSMLESSRQADASHPHRPGDHP